MKENLKNKKGITLIALVITIIVLLILAIVTIRIVVNQNIINHANNAVTAYNEAQNNESEQLTWAEELMKNKGGSSTSGSGNSHELFSVAGVNAVSGGQNENDRIVALNGNGSHVVMFTLQDESTAFIINVVLDDKIYMMVKDINDIEALLIGDATNLKANTWYMTPLNNLQNGKRDASLITEYTGEAPINRDSFTNILDETYLQKVINSFNN